MPRFRTLDDIDVRGKRVLLRADLNVPIRDGVVTDATRIERLAPTIEALIDKGAKVVVMSHFGRPKGKTDPALSLRPLIAPLARAIGGREWPSPRIASAKAQARRRALRPGRSRSSKICASTRRRKRTRPTSRARLATLGDVYVDDAFSAAHRAHASIDALARSAAGRGRAS